MTVDINFENLKLAPKIYALAPLKKIEGLLKTQKLLKFQKMLNLSELSLYKSKEEIDTKYILSVLCENYFKEMMDEYLSKSLFNGYINYISKIYYHE